ncbi:MAG: hypothetical protein VKJ02_04160 [Snowella sp.]|nr:hypothetical protein [Snowella sp.]
MVITTTSSITDIIPYSLLKGGKKPTFGNHSVEKFLLSATKTLQQARPDNISLVIAIAPGQKIVNEAWKRPHKPVSITFYAFFEKKNTYNTFSVIETLSKILVSSYRQTKILALIDPLPTQVPPDFHLFSGEIKAKLISSGCLLYSAYGR